MERGDTLEKMNELHVYEIPVRSNSEHLVFVPKNEVGLFRPEKVFFPSRPLEGYDPLSWKKFRDELREKTKEKETIAVIKVNEKIEETNKQNCVFF